MDKDKVLMRRRARDLRTNSTDTERHLWYYLRANRLGYKFKRQVPLGNYIVDFICYEKKLIIELDGGQHQDNANYDANRTNFLNQKGFKVLRFWNNDVLTQTHSVLELICKELLPLPNPLPRARSTISNTPFAGEGADRGN